MSEKLQIWSQEEPFPLEYGGTLPSLRLAYHTWGTLNDAGDNVILITHALTGSSDVTEWWDPTLGPGNPLDSEEYCIICINNLGSPYGSTSPLTYSQENRDPTTFPLITIRDTVHAHKLLLDDLGVTALRSVIGGSMGGMLSLEWALLYPEYVQSIVSIGSSARHSAWCIGISAMQRDAIKDDPDWNGGHYAKNQPVNGLALARKIAMVSYRSSASFQKRFGREFQRAEENYYTVESYLDYQGNKLVNRFDANCYIALTEIMDTHDVGRNRDGHIAALKQINVPSLIIGVSSDILYPPQEQKELAEYIPNSKYYEINSENGHDAFLIDFDQVNEALEQFKQAWW
ncbi:MAG: homoserine O-acetyltransferase [Candidatus Marinimicrobia bacterium]|nr:homoserine O-acetyltransferase [Candidatus Neomarinimicrobiota bacterium]MCF7828679.1 homoserine O-acetyltransferase [Candidatus Neomarinimicrobiota bacterium]MCF7880420.1 homoserine O-acetyltransferase [Candidatus Neomarinimicrobiota bacterium]